MFGNKKLFDLRINDSEVGQVLRRLNTGMPFRVQQYGIINANIYQDVREDVMVPIDNFLDEIVARDITKFYLERTFSLGDLLMLVPVYRRLRELGFEPYIRTLDQYSELLGCLRIYHDTIDMFPTPEGYGINLDYVVERDHYDKRLQKMHRVEIYHKILGLDFDKNRLDWSSELGRFPETDWDGKQYIVFQGRGATENRGLDAKVIQDIIYFFNLEKINCVYIGEKIPLKGDENYVKFQYMDSTLPELFSWVANARLVITMDSSPLWVSHFTRTPVHAILGPSRPQERVALHPLYPDRATYTRLNEEIKCKSCFEDSKECNDRYDCLKDIPSDKLYAMLRLIIKRYWGL